MEAGVVTKITGRSSAPVAIVLATLILATVATGVQASSKGSSNTSAPVTWALPAGQTPNYIFPLIPPSVATNTAVYGWEYLMYRPLYWVGDDGKVALNKAESLAYPPVFSDGDQVVSIRLKPRMWSDGQPITSRDVEFWMNELMAEKANWWGYSPGFFPDDVTSIAYPSATTIRITFNHGYSPSWILYNNLTQIIPIPQQVWDREAATSPVGNYDLTSSGAEAVYSFLNGQSSDLDTYTTNPLWKVVDGPWRLTGYDPSTSYSIFQPNRAYDGPGKPTIAKFEEVPFTSDAAEFNALRSGSLDYGYLPTADAGQSSYLKSHGYEITAWPDWGIGYLPLSFANPHTGPIIKQLYIRQAMQHLINQTQLIRDVLKGYGYPTYGPVPAEPPSQFSSPSQDKNPYPYSAAAAVQLLKSHGWTVHRHGTSICSHAGSSPNECGAGIKQGTALRFQLLYSSGVPALAEEMEALQTSFSQAGIAINLRQAPFGQVAGQWSVCSSQNSGGCSWEILAFGYNYTITYSPTFYPTGDILFTNGSPYGGGYTSNETTSLIHQSDGVAGVSALKHYDQYVAKQLPVLWIPNGDNQISVIKKDLTGVLPQDPNLNIYPELWRWS